MMKKVWALFLCAMLMFTAACTGKPVNAGEKALASGRRAVEIADEYLDMKIDTHEAEELLDDVYERLSYLDNMSRDDPCYIQDLLISCSVQSVKFGISQDSFQGPDAYNECLNARNDLASKVGIKKR